MAVKRAHETGGIWTRQAYTTSKAHFISSWRIHGDDSYRDCDFLDFAVRISSGLIMRVAMHRVQRYFETGHTDVVTVTGFSQEIVVPLAARSSLVLPRHRETWGS